MEHTPTPWYVEVGCSERIAYIYPETNAPRPIVAEVPLGFVFGGGNGSANAEFIVRACNSHEELLRSLKELQEMVEPTPERYVTLARAADVVDRAEGKGE